MLRFRSAYRLKFALKTFVFTDVTSRRLTANSKTETGIQAFLGFSFADIKGTTKCAKYPLPPSSPY
jgi:hypothetical protein